jgi:hypothetical protein
MKTHPLFSRKFTTVKDDKLSLYQPNEKEVENE